MSNLTYHFNFTGGPRQARRGSLIEGSISDIDVVQIRAVPLKIETHNNMPLPLLPTLAHTSNYLLRYIYTMKTQDNGKMDEILTMNLLSKVLD